MTCAHIYLIVAALGLTLNAMALAIFGLLDIFFAAPIWHLPEFGMHEMASSTAFALLSIGAAVIVVCHIILKTYPFHNPKP